MNCPCCGCSDTPHYEDADDASLIGKHFGLFRCAACGHVFSEIEADLDEEET